MKRLAPLLAVLALGASGVASATPDSRVLLYGGAGQGRVVFDARLHRSKGFVCDDCHRDLFATRKGAALVDIGTHGSGKACFACHDGKRAFDSCEGCHRKP